VESVCLRLKDEQTSADEKIGLLWEFQAKELDRDSGESMYAAIFQREAQMKLMFCQSVIPPGQRTHSQISRGSSPLSVCRFSDTTDPYSLPTVFGLLFASIAISYYRQLLDPSSLVTRNRNDVPLNTFNGPYAGGSGNYYNNPYPPPEGRFGPGYSGHPDYAPPYDNAKLPGYAGEPRKSDEEEKPKPNPAGQGPPGL
jgi:hypothetical protein